MQRAAVVSSIVKALRGRKSTFGWRWIRLKAANQCGGKSLHRAKAVDQNQGSESAVRPMQKVQSGFAMGHYASGGVAEGDGGSVAVQGRVESARRSEQSCAVAGKSRAAVLSAAVAFWWDSLRRDVSGRDGSQQGKSIMVLRWDVVRRDSLHRDVLQHIWVSQARNSEPSVCVAIAETGLTGASKADWLQAGWLCNGRRCRRRQWIKAKETKHGAVQ